MSDGHINDLIDKEAARENKIHHRADLARVAVLKREHRAVAFAVLNGSVCLGEVGVGYQLRIREHTQRRNIGKRALVAAVGDLHAAEQL